MIAEEISIAGDIATETIETNGDDQYDLLRLTMPLSVQRAATYAVLGVLLGPSQETISAVQERFDWAVGTRTMTINFPGVDSGASGVDGLYRISVQIVEVGSAEAIFATNPLVQTAAYRSADFEGGQLSMQSIYMPLIRR